MIYFLTAIGFPPPPPVTVVRYTSTHIQYREQFYKMNIKLNYFS